MPRLCVLGLLVFSLTAFASERIAFHETIQVASVKRLIERLQVRHSPVQLSLKSEGGQTQAGLALGLYLHQQDDVSVEIGPEARCESACAYAFLAAKHRYMGPGAQIGLHRPSVLNGDKTLSRSEIQRHGAYSGAVLGQYYQLLGVDDRLLYQSLEYGSSDVWYLDRSELAAYGVSVELAPAPK